VATTRGRRRLVTAGLVAMALLAAPDAARGFGKNKVAYTEFAWSIYASPHFDVYYYPQEAAMLEQTVSYAESQYTRLSQILDHEIPFRINLIIYRTHVEFEQTNIALGFIPEYVAAFSEPIADRMVIPIDLPPDELYELFGHELAHVFQFSILFQESISRAFRANTPGWVMEGMASFLAQDESSIDRMIIRDAVIYGLIPPIHRLQVTNFLTYRFGNAAFSFIEEKYGQEGLRTFIMEFRKSLLSNNIAKPIQDAFGIDGDEFDRQFKKYLQRKYLPILLEKKEPQDYGPEIARKKPGEEDVVNFSPALSPSGELLAVLTTRWNDIDVAILSAKDGKVFRPLTKGFTNEYESLVYGAFQGKKDLTWSPDGDRVAFFARRENERVLLVHSSVSGKLERRISIPGIDDELSPAWSPDGKSIVFEGARDGVTDIFAFDLETGVTRNVTQDPFFDSNPSWSPDGTQILYDRRIGPYNKVFLTDSADPSRKIQLTFGDSDDLQPSFSRDAKTVYFASDADGGIYNAHTLSLETGDLARLTSLSGGAFTPIEMPGESGAPGIVYAAYTEGRLRVYRMTPGEPEAVVRAADQAREPADLEPFEPPLRLTLDEAAMKPYDKIHYHIENAPSIYVGVADDGTFLGSTQILLSDLLGDNRMFIDFQTVSTFSNFYFAYNNLKRRLNWGAYARDFRDYYVVQSVNTGATARERQATSVTAAGAQISYPLNRFYRVGASAGYAMRTIDRPYYTVNGTEFASLDEQFPVLTWSFNGDTTRFKSFGPYHGQRFMVSQQWAPTLSASGDTDQFVTGTFLNTNIDYRIYRRVTDRSLFAIRLASYISQGEGYSIYSLGGLNYLRGYEFRELYGSRVSFANIELRFPLVDALAFPIGVLRDIRGFLFFDIGSAWFQGDAFTHPQMGGYVTNAMDGVLTPFVPCLDTSDLTTCAQRGFDFWDSENNQLGDGRASYGFGFNVWLGPFQLTWSFAHQLENTIQVCDTSGDGICHLSTDITRIPDPFHESGTIGQFYIATDF